MIIRILIVNIVVLFSFIPMGFCATQVSQYGITWYFDGDYTVGQYFNGDHYVIDPGGGVTITNVSPAPTHDVYSGPTPSGDWNGYQSEWGSYRYLNGTMVNPEVGAQSYDSFGELFAVGPEFDTDLWAANQYPMTVSAPASVVSTDSIEYESGGDYRPCLYTMAVLTVVSEAPQAGSFRPGYMGSVKTTYSTNDIQWDLLPDWSPTANSPNAATVASRWVPYFQRPWMVHGSGAAHRHIMPTQNCPSYHRDVAMRLSHGAALMMVDYGDRKDLVQNYLQVCIDYYTSVNSCVGGTTKPPYNYKFQIVFLGLMLNNPTIRDFWLNTADSNTQSYHQTKIYFGGDPLHIRTEYDGVIPQGETWTYYNQSTGRTPTFYTTDELGAANYGEHEHLHPDNWVPMVEHCSSYPCRTESYRQMHSVSLVGHILSLSALNATRYLNQDSLVHYAYRWMYESGDTLTSNGGFTTVYDVQTSGETFVDELWAAHAGDYAPFNDSSTTGNDGLTTTGDDSTATGDDSTATNDVSVNNDDPLYTGEAFRDDFNGTEVDSSFWQVATWAEHGGQTGTERCYVEDGYLNLIFINDSDEGYLSSGIQTRDTFLYGRWEARLKPSSVPGILNSMFTIDWGDGSDSYTRQEIDIEFLTNSFAQESGQVHYAVHARDRESFETNPDVALDFNPSDDFHVWGFEITPEHIQWFVDDTVLMTYVYSQGDITINAPYQLKFNSWTSTQWVGGPPEPDVPCIYQIDWIRFIPYEELSNSGENVVSAPSNLRIIE